MFLRFAGAENSSRIFTAPAVAKNCCSDQVKSLDWKIRKAKMKDIVSIDTMMHVKAKVKALLQIA